MHAGWGWGGGPGWAAALRRRAAVRGGSKGPARLGPNARSKGLAAAGLRPPWYHERVQTLYPDIYGLVLAHDASEAEASKRHRTGRLHTAAYSGNSLAAERDGGKSAAGHPTTLPGPGESQRTATDWRGRGPVWADSSRLSSGSSVRPADPERWTGRRY